MPTKKAQSGKPAPASTKGKKPNALQKPLQPSKELAAVVGSELLPRGQVVSKIWDLHQEEQPAELGEPPRDIGR